MRRLYKISEGMQRFANRKYMIPLAVVFIIILVLMEISPISSSRLEQISGGRGMLDMQFGYSPAQTYTLLNDLGLEGRQVYTGLLGLDFAFAVVFMLLQSLLFTNLLNRVGASPALKLINLLPFVRSALDMLENICLLALLFNHPNQLQGLVGLASTITMLKWIVYRAVIAIALILGVITTTKNFLPKNKIQLGSKTI